MNNRKFYYDTEFLEGKQSKRFLGLKIGQTKPTIDLISIGIVSDDNREYYAISKDFNLKEAWNRYDIEIEQVYGDQRNLYPDGKIKKVYWIRENVLKPIWRELIIESEQDWFAYATDEAYYEFLSEVNGGLYDERFTYKSLSRLLKKYGKTNDQIKKEVFDFISDEGEEIAEMMMGDINKVPVHLYGYYSAYDHVVFCWLFGKMIDLPDNFPMYTRDLKQIFDEKQEFYFRYMNDPEKILYYYNSCKIFIADGSVYDLKKHPDYPKQENEHSAIHDARWTKKLHEFLIKMS